jgi:uncharacterized protein
MTTDRAPGEGSVEPRTIPTPRVALDDEPHADDTQVMPRVPEQRAPVADEPDRGADGPVEADAAGEGSDDAAPPGEDGAPAPDGAPVVLPAGDSAPVALPPPPRAPADDARVYVDGSALSRYLVGAPARDAWLAWADEHERELVTTALGLTELRRIAQPRGLDARGTAVDVGGRIEVARFSDQTLRKASKVSGVLPPFVALHLGAALAHPGVTAVATYDRQLAQVASLYGLAVVTPGWPDRWWERGA